MAVDSLAPSADTASLFLAGAVATPCLASYGTA